MKKLDKWLASDVDRFIEDVNQDLNNKLEKYGKVYGREVNKALGTELVSNDYVWESDSYKKYKEEKTMNGFIQMIKKQCGVYIDLDIIEDPCTLPDYMTVKITASTAKYGGGKEVNYKFQTTTVTESYLKEKIMEVVRMLNEASKHDLVVRRGDAKSMYTSIGSLSNTFSFSMDYRHQIKKVIFNDPATIIFWEDGSKTVVKCQPDDKYDKMTGFAMACTKYMFGNEGNYYEVFKKWVGEEKES